jgi:hypothetical protein
VIAKDIYPELEVDYLSRLKLKKNPSKPSKNQVDHCNFMILTFHIILRPNLSYQLRVNQ